MKEVGIYDAKTHFAALVEEVESGEVVTITRHGRPVIQMVPLPRRRMTPAEAVAAMKELRKGNRLGDVTIRELIDEGRKY